MTLSTLTNRSVLAGNSSSTAFPFPYYLLQAADIVVKTQDTATGVVTALVSGTDYTLSGTLTNGAYLSGCTVNTTVAPATGTNVIMYRDPTATQAAHWVDLDPDPAIVKETAFDKLTMLVQRMKDLLSRSLVLDDGYSTAFSMTLPSLLPGNSALSTKADGSGFELIGLPTTLGSVSSVALSAPAEFSVAGTPITSTGTLVITKANQSANRVWAGPASGGGAVPAFRALVAADIPSFALTSLLSGAATNGQVATADGSGGVGWVSPATSGTVTSVALTAPAEFTVSGSPITGSGTLAFTKATQAANLVWAGPTSGASSAPTFRSLVAADIPSFALTSLSSGAATNGQVPKADGSGGIAWGTPAAGSGGGGGSLQWIEDDTSPIASTSSHVRVYNFVSGLSQNLYADVLVPNSYVAGSPIKMRLTELSPDSSGTMLMQAVATLIRTGTDAISSTTNQRTTTNTAVTLGAGTVSIPQAVVLDISSSSGQVNSVAISPGDHILVKLTRGTDTGASDISVPVFGAEVTFT